MSKTCELCYGEVLDCENLYNMGYGIRYGFKQVDYLEEHGECLIPAQAIGKLKKIG